LTVLCDGKPPCMGWVVHRRRATGLGVCAAPLPALRIALALRVCWVLVGVIECTMAEGEDTRGHQSRRGYTWSLVLSKATTTPVRSSVWPRAACSAWLLRAFGRARRLSALLSGRQRSEEVRVVPSVDVEAEVRRATAVCPELISCQIQLPAHVFADCGTAPSFLDHHARCSRVVVSSCGDRGYGAGGRGRARAQGPAHSTIYWQSAWRAAPPGGQRGARLL
jgi:hypothetical protein